jgi:hypothetical protein
MKFLNFFYFHVVGNFCPPGPGSTDLIESGSETLDNRTYNFTKMAVSLLLNFLTY